MSIRHFTGGTIILPDRLLEGGSVTVAAHSRITAIDAPTPPATRKSSTLQGGYLAPGFVDLHVHGGAGADFMDGTADAFRTVCQAHARHGTTSLLPTTTVARHEQHLAFLDVCRRLKAEGTGGAAHSRRSLLRPLFRRRGARLSSRRGGASAGAGRILRLSRLRRLHRHGDRRPGTAGRRGVRPRLPRARHSLQRRPFARHLRAGRGRDRLGRPPRRSSVLRHVRPRPAAADADVSHARRPDGSDAVLRRADHRGHRRRQAPDSANCCCWRTRSRGRIGSPW